jgi:hypothetical protein
MNFFSREFHELARNSIVIRENSRHSRLVSPDSMKWLTQTAVP